jgi:hypothetical protein
MAVLGSCLHRIRASLHIIAQDFGFTRDFLKERNNSAYCRLKKIPCGFKEQARACHPGEKCGLVPVPLRFGYSFVFKDSLINSHIMG